MYVNTIWNLRSSWWHKIHCSLLEALEEPATFIYLEDRGTRFLQNTVNHQWLCMVSQPRRQYRNVTLSVLKRMALVAFYISSLSFHQEKGDIWNTGMVTIYLPCCQVWEDEEATMKPNQEQHSDPIIQR